jgi:hypothetical protein
MTTNIDKTHRLFDATYRHTANIGNTRRLFELRARRKATQALIDGGGASWLWMQLATDEGAIREEAAQLFETWIDGFERCNPDVTAGAADRFALVQGFACACGECALCAVAERTIERLVDQVTQRKAQREDCARGAGVDPSAIVVIP